EDAGIVDVIDEAAAAPLARGLARPMARGVAVPVGESLAFRQRRRVVADIIGPAGPRLMRHRRWRDEIAAAQLGAVDAAVARRLIDEPLDDVDRLGPSGAAIRYGGRGIGEDRA